jgi:SPP1 family predicted phage head-tail adaptor
MNPGKLDRRVQLQSKTVTKDTAGAPVETWTTFATVWAAKAEQGSREFKAFGQVQAECTALFTARYLSIITAEHRIVCDGRIFEITGTPLEQGRRELLVLPAKETKGRT